MKFATAKDEGVTLRVRVQPRASRTSIRGESEGVLRVAVAAPPVDGAANEALIRFFAERCGIRREMVTITSGLTSRNKTITIRGVSLSEASQALRIGSG
jgi:uncharacterized protein (TIGR00251 family)